MVGLFCPTKSLWEFNTLGVFIPGLVNPWSVFACSHLATLRSPGPGKVFFLEKVISGYIVADLANNEEPYFWDIHSLESYPPYLWKA